MCVSMCLFFGWCMCVCVCVGGGGWVGGAESYRDMTMEERRHVFHRICDVYPPIRYLCSKHPLANVPRDIQAQFHAFLPCASQAAFSQICSAWRDIAHLSTAQHRHITLYHLPRHVSDYLQVLGHDFITSDYIRRRKPRACTLHTAAYLNGFARSVRHWLRLMPDLVALHLYARAITDAENAYSRSHQGELHESWTQTRQSIGRLKMLHTLEVRMTLPRLVIQGMVQDLPSLTNLRVNEYWSVDLHLLPNTLENIAIDNLSVTGLAFYDFVSIDLPHLHNCRIARVSYESFLQHPQPERTSDNVSKWMCTSANAVICELLSSAPSLRKFECPSLNPQWMRVTSVSGALRHLCVTCVKTNAITMTLESVSAFAPNLTRFEIGVDAEPIVTASVAATEEETKRVTVPAETFSKVEIVSVECADPTVSITVLTELIRFAPHTPTLVLTCRYSSPWKRRAVADPYNLRVLEKFRELRTLRLVGDWETTDLTCLPSVTTCKVASFSRAPVHCDWPTDREPVFLRTVLPNVTDLTIDGDEREYVDLPLIASLTRVSTKNPQPLCNYEMLTYLPHLRELCLHPNSIHSNETAVTALRARNVRVLYQDRPSLSDAGSFQ
jgi:hypothetical protein